MNAKILDAIAFEIAGLDDEESIIRAVSKHTLNEHERTLVANSVLRLTRGKLRVKATLDSWSK